MSRIGLLSLQLLVAIVALALWQFFASVPVFGKMLLPPFFFSNPVDIGSQIVKWFSSGVIWKHLMITLWESILAFAIGSLGGNPFPDATSEFFETFARALSMGLGHNVKIEAPLRGFHKEDLIKQFKDLPLELTLTCMAPRDSQHCGQCNKCFERQQAFQKAGVVDRTVYLA